MIMLSKFARASLLLFLAVCVLLTGCLDESKVNNKDVTYTPEVRVLGVIAGEDAEYEKGGTIMLTGRLVGTVTDQTVLWEQTAGTPITGITDWTQASLSFSSPDVDGLEVFKFKISARDATGNIVADADGNSLVDEVEILIYDPSVIITIEAEDANFASLVGGASLVTSGTDYITGAVGSHTADIAPGSKVIYSIPSGSVVGDKTIAAGFYTLFVRSAIPASYGGKQAVVSINGVDIAVDFSATSSWNNTRVDVIKINEGANTIAVGGGWNYYRIDSILLIPAPKPTKPLTVAPTLVNENATAAAKDLMTFLVGNYGQKTLSGQTEFMDYNNLADKTGLREFDKVVEITEGKSPAIVAFDLMDYSSSRVNCGAEPGTLSEDMINEHNNKNIILSPLWHWNAPTKLIDASCSGSGNTAWYSGFYTTASTFNLKTALADTNSADYQALILDMDEIAAELKKFSDADIPLLWRPLHEAEGGWFWWGAADAASLKTLWQLMHDRFTEVHQLNNLIWVYTFAGELSNDWYPGDAYVDIVGYDGYDGKNAENPFKGQYSTLKDRFDGKKLVALTETGTIPNVELMHQQNAWWAYFVTWNSGGDYGPVNADPVKAKASYAYAGTLNLDDVPGGRAKVEAGLFDGFEFPTAGWEAQLSWSPVAGIVATSDWSAHALHSLSITKNLSAETDPSNVVFQVYPAAGIDTTDKNTLRITVNAINAGANTTAYVFVKHGVDWEWASTSAVLAGNATIDISVADYDWLAGIGVVFESFDTNSANATFAIDQVMLDTNLLYDFEPVTPDWSAQLGWTDTTGITLSSQWQATGERSLALIKNLSVEASPSNVVFQAYPEGGIDVSSASKLSVAANTADSGAGTTAYLFVKHGADSEWASTAAVSAGDAVIEMDVSAYDTLAGFGVVFEGFDNSSMAAKFYLDAAQLDGKTLYDFEATGTWEFQVNWSPVSGLKLANDWKKSGGFSLSGATQLQAGDDNIILQNYPAGGVLLGDVTLLRISAHAEDVGAATQVQLFVKDKDGGWKDGGAINLVDGSADLSLDVSTMGGELSGFGVRFMGPVNSTTESRYYIDDVSFE